jgi:hypothetical protein
VDISGSNRAVALYKNNHGVFELQSKAVGGLKISQVSMEEAFIVEM